MNEKRKEIICWRWPCDGKILFSSVCKELYVDSWCGIVKRKKELNIKGGCTCNQGCKPQKIKITVEVL